MTPETFLEKFDLFADAPDAVAKMRELVLQFAMQGKLVDQKRSDGNAAQLLAAISRERDTRAAKLRTPNEPASADGNDHAFPIPSNWAWTQLGNIALQIQYGYTASADPSATEIRMLRITDIQNNRVDWPSVPGCQIESGEAEKYLLSPNDILIARTGGTIGKSFIVPDAPVKSVFASYLIRVSPPQSMAARYLKAFLESPLYWSQLRQMSAGTGQPNVNGQALGRLEIPLPPLAEQKRIVAKVDELMALCDRLEAQQQERETRHAALARASLARFADAPTPANLPFLFHPSYAIPPADLRKSILTLAVQGKLVPQDPNDEPASEMLASEAKLPDGHIRRRKIMKRAPIASNAEMFPDLPPSWEYAAVQTLYDLNMIVDYADGNHGSLYPRSSEFGDSGVTFVTARDIANGRVSWEGCARLNEDRARQLTKGWARGGDVLLTHNATVGRVARVEREIGKFLLGTSATFYRLNEEFIDPSYFYDVLCSPTWQGQLEAIMEQTTRNQVSIQKQAYFQVPIPPLAEQRRIAAKVEQLMALVDALETQLAASRATAANLLSALVAELTTQNGGGDET